MQYNTLKVLAVVVVAVLCPVGIALWPSRTSPPLPGGSSSHPPGKGALARVPGSAAAASASTAPPSRPMPGQSVIPTNTGPSNPIASAPSSSAVESPTPTSSLPATSASLPATSVAPTSNNPAPDAAPAAGPETAGVPAGTGAPAAVVAGVGSQAAVVAAPPSIMVHVAGMVARPGVYTLPVSGRVVDAVRMAGGMRAGADMDAINLAAHLQDAEQIYIPPRQVAAPVALLRRSPPLGRVPLAGPMSMVDPRRVRSTRVSQVGLSGGTGSRSRSTRNNKLTDPSQGIVDLNTAGPDDLLRLPGVGPSTAARIMDFRKTSGRFTSLEDLMNVKGIGPAKFAKMRPFIRVSG